MKQGKIFNTSLKDLREIQSRKLHYFINNKLYPFSTFYRNIFDQNKINPRHIKKVTDLKHLPFTSKKDFIEAANTERGVLDFVLQPSEELIKKYYGKKELAHIFLKKCLLGKEKFTKELEKEYKPIFITATTGTTQMPVSFFYTLYDIEKLKLYGERLISLLDCGPRDKGVNIFPYAPHLAFWQTVMAGFASDVFIFSTGGGKVFGTDANIKSIKKVRPELLIGTPNYIYHLLKEALEAGERFDFIQKVVLGASRVPPGFKEKLAEILKAMGATKVSVLGTYGFTEARGAWVECPTDINISSGYHVYPDQEIFEIIDPESGEVLGEGEDGELVYTAIDASGSCVLRYRTGDLVKGGIRYDPCPHCGSVLPRISSDIVRASNVKDLQLSKIKGALVSLNTFEYILDDEKGIDEWQIVIQKKNGDPFEVDELHLYLALKDNKSGDQYTEKLNQKICTTTEVSFNQIHVVSEDEIKKRLEIETAVKAKRILDIRPQD